MSSVSQTRPTRYSIAEYLRLEREALEKHEYRDGEIVAMAGGSYNQSLIIANVIGELHSRLKGTPCRVLESNLRVRIPRKTLYTYPDASIICGRPEFDPEDSRRETVLNPRVVIEVLSPSTEGYDRGEKFARYRELDSLEEYVLISQELPRIETFVRQLEGTWLFEAFGGLDSRAPLRSVEIDLPLSEAYAGVEFPPPAAPEGEGGSDDEPDRGQS